MADRRFNLLLAAVFIGGALPIQHDCQLPGIAPGPHFFLLTFIIVLLRASPQLASPRLGSAASSLDQISSPNRTGLLQTEGNWRLQGMLCTCLCCNSAQGMGAEGRWPWGRQGRGFKKETSRWPQFSRKRMCRISFSKCIMWLGWERYAKGDDSFHLQQWWLFLDCAADTTQRVLIRLLPLVLRYLWGSYNNLHFTDDKTKFGTAKETHADSLTVSGKSRTLTQFCLNQGCHEQLRRVCTEQLNRCHPYCWQCKWQPRCPACYSSTT